MVQDKYMKREDTIIDNVLKKDKKLKELWYKKAVGSGSTENEDDLALCSKLSYYLNEDYSLIKEYFLNSPYFKSKDEEHKNKCLVRTDYLQKTIEKSMLSKSIEKNDKIKIKIEKLNIISASELQKKDIAKLKCIVKM